MRRPFWISTGLRRTDNYPVISLQGDKKGGVKTVLQVRCYLYAGLVSYSFAGSCVKKILNALNPACPGMAIRISW